MGTKGGVVLGPRVLVVTVVHARWSTKRVDTECPLPVGAATKFPG